MRLILSHPKAVEAQRRSTAARDLIPVLADYVRRHRGRRMEAAKAASGTRRSRGIAIHAYDSFDHTDP